MGKCHLCGHTSPLSLGSRRCWCWAALCCVTAAETAADLTPAALLPSLSLGRELLSSPLVITVHSTITGARLVAVLQRDLISLWRALLCSFFFIAAHVYQFLPFPNASQTHSLVHFLARTARLTPAGRRGSTPSFLQKMWIIKQNCRR